MDINIRNVSVWHAHCDESSIEQAIVRGEDDIVWPKLTFVPPMQRRRLSPFAKMALLVANKSVTGIENKLPIVFSSRHGDLPKTSVLLADLVDENPLSPTAFGLSVHNAIPSLFSILTNNKQAINAISAGQDSFMMGLIDVYTRLKSGLAEEILFIHADQKLPKTYLGFQDEQQLSHAIAMVVSLPSQRENVANEHNISFRFEHFLQTIVNSMPASLLFALWYDSAEQKLALSSNHYQWMLDKHV
ncbi:MAG: beta-ketoacyl synthase chain length factor [Cognaticolwellia sp.]